MGIEEAVKGWLFKVALGKAIKSLAKVIVAWCASKGVIFVCTVMGMAVDTGNIASVEMVLTALINSGLTVVRNWLKHKFPKLSWI